MATTPNGWPYVAPTDHPLEYPAVSQQLANLLNSRVLDSDMAWTQPASLLNGWQNYSGSFFPFRYRKTAGLVTVAGSIKSGSIGAVFQLPVGYRLGGGGGTLYFAALGSGGTMNTMTCALDGNISVQSYGAGSTNALVSFILTYPAD